MKKWMLLSALVLSLGITFSSTAVLAQSKVVCTTLDIKQDYDIIGVVSLQVNIDSELFSDPLDKALEKIWPKFLELAEKAGADAVVGLRFDFENIQAGGVGRLLIYGTAVKFKK